MQNKHKSLEMTVQIQASARKLSAEWLRLKLYFVVRIYHKPGHSIDSQSDVQYEQNQLQNKQKL